MDKLKELQASFTKINAEFKQVFGLDNQTKDKVPSYNEEMDRMAKYVYNCMNNMQQQIYAAQDMHYRHQEGHLPKLTPSAMNKMLKVAGLDGDYVAKPKQIYSSNIVMAKSPSKGLIMEAEYKKQ